MKPYFNARVVSIEVSDSRGTYPQYGNSYHGNTEQLGPRTAVNAAPITDAPAFPIAKQAQSQVASDK